MRFQEGERALKRQGVALGVEARPSLATEPVAGRVEVDGQVRATRPKRLDVGERNAGVIGAGAGA